VGFPEEHPNAAKTAGLALGFTGVLLLLGPWRSLGGGELQGQLACAGAALCYGLAFLYTRRHLAGRPEGGIALSAAQLLCATAMLAPALPLTGAPTVHIGLKGLGSLLALGVLGSGVAYTFNYAIVRAAGATVASTVTYLIPVFSTLLGVLVLGETLTWNEPVGAVVLLLGIALSQGRLRIAGAGAGGSGSRSRSRRPRRPRRDTAG
jgi:drug/metabolite transporter (DMT)-like permease